MIERKDLDNNTVISTPVEMRLFPLIGSAYTELYVLLATQKCQCRSSVTQYMM